MDSSQHDVDIMNEQLLQRSAELLEKDIVSWEVRYKIVFWGVISCSLVKIYRPF